MYKKLKKRNRIGMIIGIIVPLVIGIAIFWFNDETRDYLLTGDDINSLSGYEVHDGDIVHGNLYAILGCYAEDEEGAYYIIPVGEDEYMGVFLEWKYEDRAVQILNDTVDYINGDREDLSSYSIQTRGIVYAMGTVEQQYFHEWFTDSGYLSEDEISYYTIDYTYEVIPFHKWNLSSDITCYVLIGICLAIALFLFIWLVTGQDIAQVKKTIQKNGWIPEEVETDILSGYEKRHVMIGRKYILRNSGMRWQLYSVRDVVWAYQSTHTTEHRLYGVIKTGTTVAYSVLMYLRNGKQVGITIKSAGEAQEILEYFQRTQPHIILGYSDQLMAICRQNFNQLVQLSNEKEMQQQKQEYYDGTNQQEQSWQDDEPTLKFHSPDSLT